MELETVVTTYFLDLFSTSNPRDLEDVIGSLHPIETNSMNLDVLRAYTMEEIKQASFQMQPMKAPSLDGMPPVSFKSNGIL